MPTLQQNTSHYDCFPYMTPELPSWYGQIPRRSFRVTPRFRHSLFRIKPKMQTNFCNQQLNTSHFYRWPVTRQTCGFQKPQVMWQFGEMYRSDPDSPARERERERPFTERDAATWMSSTANYTKRKAPQQMSSALTAFWNSWSERKEHRTVLQLQVLLTQYSHLSPFI